MKESLLVCSSLESFFLKFYLCVCACAGAFRSPKAGATGSYELPTGVLGTELPPSARTTSVLKHIYYCIEISKTYARNFTFFGQLHII